MGFTALGLGFNHWERHKPFLKGKWDFYPFTIFDFIIWHNCSSVPIFLCTRRPQETHRILAVFSHSHPMPRRHPISCCGLSPGSFCFLRLPYWKTRRRWDDGNDIRTSARDRSKWCPIYILEVFHLTCTHYGEITTMLARPPFSSDLLNFGTKTIQINNSPNTFICDTCERNIAGLIDILITLQSTQPTPHQLEAAYTFFGASVSFFPSPFFVILSSQLSRRPRAETLAA